MRARALLSPGFFYFALVTLFLYLPIGLLILFSFNDGTTMVFPLKGFTLRWYSELLEADELLEAMQNSLVLGLAASLTSTLFGTMAAIGITRFNFPGRGLFLSIASLPLVIPYVVLAVALLLLFRNWNIELTLWTVGAAHVVVNIPYVMLIVAARLAGFEQNLEEAAMDLGATYWGTLMRVTLPISA
ncbi:MAG: ABC transporter permease subunit, partial [Acidobacteria bacterium]|nr:ABC transporter permease subunit [Acidobacteriota bacterium]